MSNALSEMKRIVAEMEELRQQMTERGKLAISEGSKALFDAHPGLEKFGWNQYTPYFNDGDACTFRVNRDEDYDLGIEFEGYALGDAYDSDKDPHPELENAGYYWHWKHRTHWNEADAAKVEGSFKDGNRWKSPNPEYNERLGSVFNDVRDFANAFPEDLLERVFGDHIRVTFTRTDDGVAVETEDYSHD